MLGVTWAVLKCHKFLAGLPHFQIITDHNLLLAILNHRRPDEAQPFCVTTPHTIPCAYRDKVKDELDTLQS